MRRERIVILLLAVAAALPIVAIALWSIRQTASSLADSCAEWNHAADAQGALSASIGPQDPCRVKTVHFQSKAQALILAAVVPGGLLAFALLAVAGAALSRRRLVISGAIGILAETIVVFTIAPLTLIIGVSLLFLSRRVHSDP